MENTLLHFHWLMYYFTRFYSLIRHGTCINNFGRKQILRAEGFQMDMSRVTYQLHNPLDFCLEALQRGWR